MAFRGLTYAEMAQFVQENAATARWELVRQFAVDLFGPTVHTAELKYDTMYGAESGLTYMAGVVDITVRDVAVRVLDPSRSSALLTRRWARYYQESIETATADDVRDIVVELCHELGHQVLYPGLRHSDVDRAPYDLNAPPRLDHSGAARRGGRVGTSVIAMGLQESRGVCGGPLEPEVHCRPHEGLA
jgi:hypothetical protein